MHLKMSQNSILLSLGAIILLGCTDPSTNPGIFGNSGTAVNRTKQFDTDQGKFVVKFTNFSSCHSIETDEYGVALERPNGDNMYMDCTTNYTSVNRVAPNNIGLSDRDQAYELAKEFCRQQLRSFRDSALPEDGIYFDSVEDFAPHWAWVGACPRNI